MAQLGQHDAFAEYVLSEIKVLYRVACSLTSRPADAEYLVQDTLRRAFRFIDRFDGRHPRIWLLTILRNTESLRRCRLCPQLFTDTDEVVKCVETDPVNTGHIAEEPLGDVVFDSVVERALAALPDKYRKVVELVDVEGFSYSEAAVVIGVPACTVRSRLHCARDWIRRRLMAEGVTPE